VTSETRISTGSLDFSGGVDAQRVPTISGPQNPDGLRPNQIAWGQNVTVRGGGAGPRGGWRKLVTLPISAKFQESTMYDPLGGLPYVIAQIGGRTFRIRVDTDNSVEELTIAGDANPADYDQAWMCQGEEFLVIQDGTSNPLFWDGSTLRRSRGAQTAEFVTAANFNAPAVGSEVLVDLSGPYTGARNAVLTLENGEYVQVDPNNYLHVHLSAVSPGGPTAFPIGTVVTAVPTDGVSETGPSVVIGRLIAPASVPHDGSYTGLWLDTATQYLASGLKWINIGALRCTTDDAVLPAAGANQVYLVNITDTPADVIEFPAYAGGAPELPPAKAMDYYMGRMWLALGREYIAGDIVGGPSGSGNYQYRDAILKVTENEYISEGGVFRVPDNAGDITALKHAANLDTALGEGVLFPFTRNRVYSVNVVPTRSEWQALSEPIQRVAQISYGTSSDRSVVPVNGDLFCQSMDGVRSFMIALRYFNQWGNRSISSELDRVMKLNDRSWLWAGSGIEFDNRLFQTCLPEQTDIGVVHKAIAVMDFDRMSTIQEQKPPVWEGVYNGLEVLRLMTADFGGLPRAFAFVRGSEDAIELWEITSAERWDTNDYGEARVQWVIETPSYTWSDPFALKELDTLEIWFDQIQGTVDYTVYYRPDQHPCWEYWHRDQICAPRDNCEVLGVDDDPCYPTQQYRPQYRVPVVLPRPPKNCEFTQNPGRPMNLGFAFQFKIVVHGAARIRGIRAHALPKGKQPFFGLSCP
jgi:hypothetical protein